MNDILSLARRINEREEVIDRLRKLSLSKACETITEAVLQGQDLLRAKAALPHGQWLPWLARHCPRVGEREAQRYMRVASNPARVSDLVKAGSLRGALALLEEGEPTKGEKDVRRWPPYIEAIGRLSKLAGYCERCPIEKWPAEGVDKFREEMLPIAQKLWPDKFQ